LVEPIIVFSSWAYIRWAWRNPRLCAPHSISERRTKLPRVANDISLFINIPGLRETVYRRQPTVELRTVPSYAEYRYPVMNDQRVIMDPRTRRVIRIID
jgi:hypothetical protein